MSLGVRPLVALEFLADGLDLRPHLHDLLGVVLDSALPSFVRSSRNARAAAMSVARFAFNCSVVGMRDPLSAFADTMRCLKDARIGRRAVSALAGALDA